ncbi:MAG: AAA family ATPase [Planctomycetales bacterium]|nr:AAA family ATPase [Planctomycetales bacterium]
MNFDQAAVIAALSHCDAYGVDSKEIEIHETHISWIFLIDQTAYKLKKALSNDFLDYSTLEKREHYCREELRLDSRFAPELYMDVVPVTFDKGQFYVQGVGQVVEWLVKMKRFEPGALLSERLGKGVVSPQEIDQLAHVVANAHGAAVAGRSKQQQILEAARDNFRTLASCLSANIEDLSWSELKAWTETEFQEHERKFRARAESGFVRECHGDLHAGNIVSWRGSLVPFDGIEFCDEFRWIDVLSDTAFLVMDLIHRGYPALAAQFLNTYLEVTGDYEDLELLRWYLVYRAMVRAKVAALLMMQSTGGQRQAAQTEVQQYIFLAEELRRSHIPRLWITHGVSGSGKSTGSMAMVRDQGAIRLRSDVERKRYDVLISSNTGFPVQVRYDKESVQRIYRRLLELARRILKAGFSVIVDATFLDRGQRDKFRELAAQLRLEFAILSFQAPVETLRSRINDRLTQGGGPSDAGLDVLKLQLQTQEPLGEDELSHTFIISEECDTSR